MSRKKRGIVFATILAAVITAAAALGSAIIAAPRSPHAHSGSVYAKVTNTRGSGTWAYAKPTRSSNRTEGPDEGELVVVDCQVRDGQPVTDLHDPQPSQPAGWPVWDRLEDGRFIPDVWTDLPKDTRAKDPPNGLPDCPT